MERHRTALTRRFHIWVDGTLSERFADGLDGIEQSADEFGTVLHGDYVDESHLHSVLTHLHRLAICVRRLEVDPRPDRTHRPGHPADADLVEVTNAPTGPAASALEWAEEGTP